jgi:hypothetical protein
MAKKVWKQMKSLMESTPSPSQLPFRGLFGHCGARFGHRQARLSDLSAAFGDQRAGIGHRSAAFGDRSAAFGDKSAAFDDRSAAFGDRIEPRSTPTIPESSGPAVTHRSDAAIWAI